MLRKFSISILICLILSMALPETVPLLGSANQVQAATVKLNKSKAIILKGKTLTLSVNGSTSKIRWSSSIPSIATVSSKGKVTAKSAGKTNIIAKIGKKSLTCKVTVESPYLNTTSVNIAPAKKYSLQLLNTTQKVTWKSSNTSVVKVSKSGKVTAVKTGKAKVTASIPGKNYTCTIRVSTDYLEGSRTNPLYAFNTYTGDVYDYTTKLGKFNIKLLDYKEGDEALTYLSTNEYLDLPESDEEYVYVKFELNYISGSKLVNSYDVVNYVSGFFNSGSNYQMNPIGWATVNNDAEDFINVSLYPGGSSIFYIATKYKKGFTPLTYRIQTGYDLTEYEPTYTWFYIK